MGTVLDGLGFRKEDWDRRTEEFSGGWQMRIALAKLLLEKPNLLLLDEPTNHLDLEARNWLESYLTNYPFGYVLISHDRYFLDVTVNRTVEIWNKRVQFYSGNYDKYLGQKAERKAQLEAAYRNQRERIEQLEAFINRFRYQATKAKQVQSRIKELEKIERIEIPPDEQTIHFSFPQPKPSGRIVAEFKDVVEELRREARVQRRELHDRARRPHRAGGRQRRGQIHHDQAAGRRRAADAPASTRWATTCCRIISRRISTRSWTPNARMLDDLSSRRAARQARPSCARCWAASCSARTTCSSASACFPAASATATRWRACCWRPSNFLLLDEPTNHLDMRAKDVLLEALASYTGTVVFVSHDRYFIDKLATRVFEIEDGHVHVYPGNYEDYLWRKAGGPEALNQTVSKPEPAPEPVPAPDHEDAVKRVNPIKLKKLKDRLGSVEKEVAALESEIARARSGAGGFQEHGRNHAFDRLGRRAPQDPGSPHGGVGAVVGGTELINRWRNQSSCLPR